MEELRPPWSFILLLSSSIKVSLGEIPYAPRGIGGLSDFGGDVSQYMSLLKGDMKKSNNAAEMKTVINLYSIILLLGSSAFSFSPAGAPGLSKATGERREITGYFLCVHVQCAS